MAAHAPARNKEAMLKAVHLMACHHHLRDDGCQTLLFWRKLKTVSVFLKPLASYAWGFVFCEIDFVHGQSFKMARCHLTLAPAA